MAKPYAFKFSSSVLFDLYPGDSDSYTSKSSLQCSSGYGTMASTPAGSEDTIASGGECTVDNVFTLKCGNLSETC